MGYSSRGRRAADPHRWSSQSLASGRLDPRSLESRLAAGASAENFAVAEEIAQAAARDDGPRLGTLTTEFLDGMKVGSVGTAQAPGLDPQLIAQRGANAVLRQILVNGLFHADPHPGNILILPGNVVAFIDFGIVGRVNREMDRSSNRVSFAIVIGALVIASSIVVHSAVGPVAFGYPVLGVAGFLIAGFLGIGLAIGILRSGRL